MSESENHLRADGAAEDPLAVDASPTKAFFCSVITRDLSLEDAIADLVDNCVDGAKRLRGSGFMLDGQKLYDGLFVELNFDKTRFSISDNCGGIDLDVARKYAFKFGRDEGFDGTPGSVGQFGVGMKRALFKMGADFSVRTKTISDQYTIKVNVPDWIKDPHWDFRIAEIENSEISEDETMTEITVESLYEGVAGLFSADFFKTKVINEIKTSQQHFIRGGLNIRVNGQAIISPEWQLAASDSLKPFYKSYEDEGGKHVLRTRIYAGVGVSAPASSGWYVFCNGRCIISADQTNTTGWGDLPGTESVSVPKFHNQFTRFRGYAFMDSNDPERLPWNTTKTDLDFDHPEYMRLRRRLVEISRPVIDFLNELDREKDYSPEDQEVSRSLERAPMAPISKMTVQQEFSYQKATVKKGPVLRNIAFKKPEPEIAALQSALSVSSAKDVGIKSFEYAYSRLVEEDDL
ncbi:ATP-binding protein [Mameliella alba]|nr:ATP-binding protein [Mameliella alba]MBY6171527.1 ATP-binding protein [Mameliella alba]MBY6176751.1 ATP-binding protein [Mameliella alba]